MPKTCGLALTVGACCVDNLTLPGVGVSCESQKEHQISFAFLPCSSKISNKTNLMCNPVIVSYGFCHKHCDKKMFPRFRILINLSQTEFFSLF